MLIFILKNSFFREKVACFYSDSLEVFLAWARSGEIIMDFPYETSLMRLEGFIIGIKTKLEFIGLLHPGPSLLNTTMTLF
jgi:hypothetical protein